MNWFGQLIRYFADVKLILGPRIDIGFIDMLFMGKILLFLKWNSALNDTLTASLMMFDVSKLFI